MPGYRPRLPGSHADAEDVVQEAWLRLSGQDAAEIGNLAGWLTTVVGRLSLDVLRSRRRPPSPVGSGGRDEAPLPVVTVEPEDETVLADTVGLALLVVLESLGPDERLAFVLHDLFAVPFEEIATIVGKSTGATKMLTSRARRKIRESTPPPGARREQRRVVDAFLAAAREGDFEALLHLLHPDVRLAVDTAAGRVVTLGATKVAGAARLGAAAAVSSRAVLVDGRPGIIAWHADGTPRSILAFDVAEGRITGITAVVDPARLVDLPER